MNTRKTKKKTACSTPRQLSTFQTIGSTLAACTLANDSPTTDDARWLLPGAVWLMHISLSAAKLLPNRPPPMLHTLLIGPEWWRRAHLVQCNPIGCYNTQLSCIDYIVSTQVLKMDSVCSRYHCWWGRICIVVLTLTQCIRSVLRGMLLSLKNKFEHRLFFQFTIRPSRARTHARAGDTHTHTM